MTSQIWWYLSRATGVTAWLLATASLLWGMALSTRALGPNPRAPWLLDLHRHLGGLCILFVGAHLGSLWADSFVEFGPSELFVPLVSAWKPEPVAWGIVGMYLLVAVEVTSLLKRRISAKLWRTVHLSSYGAWAVSTVHFLRAGTDAQNLVVRVLAVASIAATAFFVVYHWVGPGRAASVRSAGGSSPRPPRPPRSTPASGSAVTLGPEARVGSVSGVGGDRAGGVGEGKLDLDPSAHAVSGRDA